jgi:hypothetical protein
MSFLSYAGDALWVGSLFIMLVAGRSAWDRMGPETRVPMRFAQDGTPTMRGPRRWALTLLPATGFIVSIVLVLANRNTAAATGPYALSLFGVRATIAALFPLAYLRWLKAAMEVLEHEGALKPPPPRS